jgi:hypothetical protein
MRAHTRTRGPALAAWPCGALSVALKCACPVYKYSSLLQGIRAATMPHCGSRRPCPPPSRRCAPRPHAGSRRRLVARQLAARGREVLVEADTPPPCSCRAWPPCTRIASAQASAPRTAPPPPCRTPARFDRESGSPSGSAGGLRGSGGVLGWREGEGRWRWGLGRAE